MNANFEKLKSAAVDNLYNCLKGYIKYYTNKKNIIFNDSAIQRYIANKYYKSKLTIISKGIRTIQESNSEDNFLDAIKNLIHLVNGLSSNYFWSWMFAPCNYWLRIYFLQCFEYIHPSFTPEFTLEDSSIFQNGASGAEETSSRKAQSNVRIIHPPQRNTAIRKDIPKDSTSEHLELKNANAEVGRLSQDNEAVILDVELKQKNNTSGNVHFFQDNNSADTSKERFSALLGAPSSSGTR